jgi:hypothetical protein
MRAALGAALLIVAPPALAEDAGTSSDAEAAAVPALLADAAALVDAASIACEGGLCETRTGTTCDVGDVSPGRPGPSAAGPLAVVAALALGASRRRSARRLAGQRASGRDAHLPRGEWARGSRPSRAPEGCRRGQKKQGLL